MADLTRALLVEAGLLAADARPSVGELTGLARTHERKLAAIQGRRQGHPVVVLSASTLDLSALAALPEDEARRLHLLPLKVTPTELFAAVTDVVSLREADAISFRTGRRLTLYLALPVLLDDAVNRAYRLAKAGDAVLVGEQAETRSPHLVLERPVADNAEADIKKLLAGLSGPLSMLRKTAEARPEARPPPPPAEVIPLGSGAAPPDTMPAPARAPVVVVIEDEEAIRTLMCRVLEKDGYEVRPAIDGRAGVEILRDGRPDLVVTDAMLPGVHGFEICSRIKHSGWSDVPVVLVSAVYRGLDHAREVQEVFGADAFLEKPFPVRLLRELVAQLLGRRVEAQELPARTKAMVHQLRDELGKARARGDDAQVWTLLDEALRLAPFDPLVHLDRGVIKESAGDLEGALHAFEAAHVYGPNMFTAATRLAATYGRLGFVRRARAVWTDALRLAPDDATRADIERVLAQIDAQIDGSKARTST